MDLDLRGHRVIVTAGAAGLARAIVEAFLAEGARVATCDIDAEGLATLPDQVLRQRVDVGDAGALRDFIRQSVADLGGLDCLVNNASIAGPTARVEDIDLAAWDQCLNICLTSQFTACAEAVPHLRESGNAAIINLSSVAALAGRDDYVAYSASKGAVAALSRSVAAFCRRRKYRIRCNTLHPDGVLTDMTRGSFPQGLDPTRLTIDSDPMNRMCLPEDVAASVLFLASDESRAINGVELRIDSGQMIMSI